MTARAVRARRGAYVDSVVLMGATRDLLARPGVAWAAALMATPANREELRGRGFAGADLEGLGAEDLVLAAEAAGPEAAAAALEAALEAVMGALVAGPAAAGPAAGGSGAAVAAPRTLAAAVRDAGLDANVAIVSVPGDYAALEAHQALSAGLHVLLFSDNVPLEAEIELKERAAGLGLLVMGPGAGTAHLGGVGLGFANVVRRGGVGVVAAAGTGAQEVMSLLDRWGAGVSHVIGVGGRDLSPAIGGRMARAGIAALAADPGTEVMLLVSKPPAPAVAVELLGRLVAAGKPAVAAFVGLDPGSLPAPPGVRLASSLEVAAGIAGGLCGARPPALGAGLTAVVAEPMAALPPARTAVRGLYSGGTLCYEAMVLLSRHLGAVHSNVPLRPEWGRPAPPRGHQCWDLGEEEFTRGRPHPMIDAASRLDPIRAVAADPSVAVLLLDVVLGWGGHPDPASVLSPACAELRRQAGGPAVVAYVLGTEGDPQGWEGQRARLAEAGCLIAPTGARAALMAAALAARRPELAEAPA